MKLNRTLGVLLVAAAAVGAGVAVAAAATTTTTTTTASTPAPTGKHWHHRGGMLVGTTLRAMHRLNLTSEQQSQVKSILAAARSQHQAAASAGAIDMTVLGNPGDPNYAAALQSAKTRAAARLQQEVELQSQIYNVLTADQKAKLPQVLADMKTKAEARRAAWLQQHSATTTTGAAGSN
jgi:Spy/CpxP family protein refolding chaperone